ncbi:single-stranded DNA-binding protein [uncultured Dubosiella sp.]|uniref:single-stranded DNA-binding protein n=1 Tax=uncultured Dubosiella sp. TaxID=1937011 RepID=UPI0032B2B779
MMNSVNLIGRLTKDPEIRMTQSGTKNCSFTLAVNRMVKQEGYPDADFINCVAWNKTAELMAQYLHKGSQIGVEGRIQTRNYENKQGTRVYVTEILVNSIQFLGSKKQEENNGYYPDVQPQYNPYHTNVQSTYQEKRPPRSNSVDPNQSYYQQPSQSYAQGNMVYGTGQADYGDPLDIASDDLPF